LIKKCLLLAALVPGAVSGNERGAINDRFLDALSNIDSGEPHAAIEKLYGLTEEVETPRIWLELARAHQKAGYHKKAIKLYAQILQKYPGMPAAVQRNIAIAIERSETAIKFIQPGLSAGYLENPYGLPDDQTLYLFGGLPFEYEAPSELREGRAYLKYSLAVTWSGADWYNLSSHIHYQDFTNSDLDRIGGTVASKFPIRGDDLTVMPFLEYQFRDDNFDGDYKQPGIGVELISAPYSKSSFTISIKRSELRFHNATQVDGFINSFSLGRRGEFGGYNVVGEVSALTFDPLGKPDFNGYDRFGLNSSIRIPSSFGSFETQLGVAHQTYNDQNPLFIKRRVDRISNFGLSIPLDSLFPMLTDWSWQIRFEKRNSNINFYDSEATTAEIVKHL
jgi:hypothetical protein